jgi:signal transduction histidine kinase
VVSDLLTISRGIREECQLLNINTKDGYTEQNLSSGEYVMLEVLDVGKGIPEDCLNKIFDPFFSKKKMGRSGSGLGLTIVKNTVLDHQGEIFVASDENGTKFTLLFPALRSELPKTSQPAFIEEIRGCLVAKVL